MSIVIVTVTGCMAILLPRPRCVDVQVPVSRLCLCASVIHLVEFTLCSGSRKSTIWCEQGDSLLFAAGATSAKCGAFPRQKVNCPRRFHLSAAPFGNEPRAAVIGHISPGPVEKDNDAVAEADQEPEMGEGPQQPCREAGEPD